MSCNWCKILEWSDTRLRFHITKTEWQETTDVDLTEYDKIILCIRFVKDTVEFVWTVDEENHSNAIFDLFSESTKWRRWIISMDVWWLKDAKKLRFNLNTVKWNILPSVKVPSDEL